MKLYRIDEVFNRSCRNGDKCEVNKLGLYTFQNLSRDI